MSLGWGYTKSLDWEQTQAGRVRTRGGERGAENPFSANSVVVLCQYLLPVTCSARIYAPTTVSQILHLLPRVNRPLLPHLLPCYIIKINKSLFTSPEPPAPFAPFCTQRQSLVFPSYPCKIFNHMHMCSYTG